jgi:hypothetical protein
MQLCGTSLRNRDKGIFSAPVPAGWDGEPERLGHKRSVSSSPVPRIWVASSRTRVGAAPGCLVGRLSALGVHIWRRTRKQEILRGLALLELEIDGNALAEESTR